MSTAVAIMTCELCSSASTDSPCAVCLERIEDLGGAIEREAGSIVIVAPDERAAERMASWADVVRVGEIRGAE